MKYTQPKRNDGRWEIEELDATAGAGLSSVDIFVRRDNRSRCPIVTMKNPDIGSMDDKEIGPNAGDLSLIAAAPLMYETLRTVASALRGAKKGSLTSGFLLRILAEVTQTLDLVYEESENLFKEADEVYEDVEV